MLLESAITPSGLFRASSRQAAVAAPAGPSCTFWRQPAELTRPLANGWYACSVSIRSGSGSATTDRVVRLTRLFRDAIAAAEYAIGEGLQWIGASRTLAR
jgi:hypothetical protein